jgi:hypothetical protein
MAYPTIDRPYGFKPVNLQGGRAFAGSTRMLPITNAFATSLFNGDVVGVASGAAAVMNTAYNAAGSNSATAGAAIGIMFGAEYSTTGGPIYGKNRYQFFLGGTATNDAVAYIVDDPLAYFRVAVLTQGTSLANTSSATIGYMNPAFVGSNAYIVTGVAGNVNTGDSAMAVTGGAVTNGTGNTRVTSASAPLRIVQVVPDTAVTYISTSTSTTSSGSTITISAADANIKAGMQFVAVNANGTYVSGCAPGNYSTVTNNNGSTSIAITGTIGASLSGATLTFIGYPEVIVGWNAGYHAYNVAGGA